MRSLMNYSYTGLPSPNSILFPGRSQTLQAACAGFPTHRGQCLLAPVRLPGTEALSQLFDYTLELKTPEDDAGLGFSPAAAANIALAPLVGQELQVTLEVEGSSGLLGAPEQRQINALISQAQYLRPEGRHHVYALRLRPWLWLADLNQDCRIFQDKTVVQVLQQLLGAYPFAVDMRLGQPYPVRDYVVQYNESDFAFFERLCQEWGIVWWFEHSQGVHRLVLADDNGAFAPNPQAAYQEVAYHPPGHKINEEYIHRLDVAEQLSAGQWSSGDVDYTRSRANLGASEHSPRLPGQAGGHHQAEVFAWPGDTAQAKAGMGGLQGQGNDANAEGRSFAQVRLQALQAPSHRACGVGHIRGLVPGHTFTLQNHPQTAANIEWLTVSATLDVEDVAEESQGSASNTNNPIPGQNWRCTATFEVQPVKLPYRAPCTRPKPQAMGWQRATVTGPGGQELWTDAYGRVKVHFAWNRYASQPDNPGKSREPQGEYQVNAQADETSSCWLRVASPWSGSQYGGVHIPRIGQEVIVSFEGGDIDRPLVTGRVVNNLNMPPWALPGNQALAGYRSKEIEGAQHNHLALDDTPGQVQAQLVSDHGKSQLSLGHITRIEGNQGRQDQRGQGFELRTDKHGAIRAQDGLLITTEGRAGASGHITSMGETTARLSQAQSQHQMQAELAQQHQAQEAGQQDEVAKALEAQNHAIKGSGTADAQAGQFPEFQEPHLTLASPAGIQATTPGSTHLHSGEHLAVTTGQDLSLSVGQSWWASVANGIRLFVREKGIKIVAAEKDIDLRALKNNIHIAALLSITERADQIAIIGEKSVELSGGDSGTAFQTGSITDTTPGEANHNTASKSLGAPKTMSVEALKFKHAQPFDEKFQIKDQATGKPLAGYAYRIEDAQGK